MSSVQIICMVAMGMSLEIDRVAALLVNAYTSIYIYIYICTTKRTLKLQCVHKAVTYMYMYEVQCTCV